MVRRGVQLQGPGQFSVNNSGAIQTVDFGNWGNSGDFGWLIRLGSTDLTFYWSNDGTAISSFTITTGSM